MSKIIITNSSGYSDTTALRLVSEVVSKGFISGENQYCWLTSFPALSVEVMARKTRGTTHSFDVRDAL